MRDGSFQRWLHRLSENSGIHRLVAHYHRRRLSGAAYGRWGRLLFAIRHSPAYPGAVGLLAILSAATGLYPFAPVLIAAVVLAPERWRGAYVAATCGAAAGAMLCAAFIQAVGTPLLAEFFPGLEQKPAWTNSAYWIGRHGWAALMVIAALPVPQIPALIVAALAHLNPVAIGLAVFLGKAVKYGVLIAVVQVALRALHRLTENAEAA